MTRVARLTALLVVVYPAAVWAQATATTAQIEGVITDQQGAAVPGVSVSARSSATGFERTGTSDATGLYRLSLLPLGTYELTAELQGFATVKRPGIVLQVGETVVVPFALRVAAVTETLTVTAESPIVEVTRSQRAASLNQTAIESLPINGRRFQDFVLLTPGAVYEPSRGGTSIGGQRGINASYAIDGASYDNPTAAFSFRRSTRTLATKTTTPTSASFRTSSIRTGRTSPPSTPGRTTMSATIS